MTDPNFDKLPAAIQVALTVGAIVASILAALFGARFKVTKADDAAARERDSTERERDRLAQQVAADAMRRDLESVVAAARTGIENRMDRIGDDLSGRVDELDDRLRKVEIAQARSEGKQEGRHR
jgi:hypothetical protein